MLTTDMASTNQFEAMTAPIMATKNGTAASGMNYDQVYRLTTHGSNRLGGNATADVLTFGRIAAKTALDLQ